MLYIYDQDRRAIIPVNNYEINIRSAYTTSRFGIYLSSEQHYCFTLLGMYNSEDRAKEVLQEIEFCLINTQNDIIKDSSGWSRNHVYKMPE